VCPVEREVGNCVVEVSAVVVDLMLRRELVVSSIESGTIEKFEMVVDVLDLEGNTRAAIFPTYEHLNNERRFPSTNSPPFPSGTAAPRIMFQVALI